MKHEDVFLFSHERHVGLENNDPNPNSLFTTHISTDQNFLDIKLAEKNEVE